jgi:hypothetical protein
MSPDLPYNRVFSGKNALLNYYDPDLNLPTPMVELPDHPYTADGVRIYAKMMNFLPAGNVKSLPGGCTLDFCRSRYSTETSLVVAELSDEKN